MEQMFSLRLQRLQREALVFNLADWTIYHDASELRLLAKVLMDFRESLVSTAKTQAGI